MELYKFIKIPIIISGVLLVILPRGSYFDSFNELILYFILVTAVFIGCIIWFNKQLISKNHKSAPFNLPKIIQSKLNLPNINFNGDSSKNYYLKILGTWFIIALYLGFKYKSIADSYFLEKAAKKDSKWQSDLFIESYKSGDNFFKLKGYYFNWEVFIVSFIIVFAIAFIIRNTIYYEKIRSYIKSIKR